MPDHLQYYDKQAQSQGRPLLKHLFLRIAEDNKIIIIKILYSKGNTA
jgi:esterase/lipase superfamily enzyme